MRGIIAISGGRESSASSSAGTWWVFGESGRVGGVTVLGGSTAGAADPAADDDTGLPRYLGSASLCLFASDVSFPFCFRARCGSGRDGST